MITQRTWRTIGAITLAICLGMGVYGRWVNFRESPRFFTVYWSIFAAMLLVTMWMVLLDVRYNLLQYRAGEREIFKNTLGDEEFRKAMRAALDEAEQEKKKKG